MRAPETLPIDPWLAEILEEVTTQWVDVPDDAPADRSILELDVRARTGASILAIRRDGTTVPNPPPSSHIHPGDSLLVLVAGERLAALEELLAGRSA